MNLLIFVSKGVPIVLIVSVNSMEARWCHKPEKILGKDEIPFDKQLVKDCISYLLDNCYFTFGEQIFKQTIGIPMGSDPVPFMANLCLYYYVSLLRSARERKIKVFISLVTFSVL